HAAARNGHRRLGSRSPLAHLRRRTARRTLTFRRADSAKRDVVAGRHSSMTSSAQVSAVDDAPVAQTELLSQARKTWPRFALLALLTLLAWHAFHDEYGTVPLLSDIDVAVHEFGHMFFMPFGVEFLGDTMMILGGSLVQIAFPLIFVAYFLRRTELGTRRDPFAATV